MLVNVAQRSIAAAAEAAAAQSTLGATRRTTIRTAARTDYSIVVAYNIQLPPPPPQTGNSYRSSSTANHCRPLAFWSNDKSNKSNLRKSGHIVKSLNSDSGILPVNTHNNPF